LNRSASDRRVRFREKGSLDEVEIVQKSDPGNPGQKMNPPQHEEIKFHKFDPSFPIRKNPEGRLAPSIFARWGYIKELFKLSSKK
jgi:hypothetical protein